MNSEKSCTNQHERICPAADCENHSRCCDCVANHAVWATRQTAVHEVVLSGTK